MSAGAVPDHIALIVRRIAALIAGGLAPAHAWRLAVRGDPSLPGSVPDVGAAAADVIALIGSPAGATRRRSPRRRAGVGWPLVAAVWWVSASTGAPLAATLMSLADELVSLAATQRQIASARAGPAATAALVLALPPLGVVAGQTLGLETAAVLLGTPLGWACLAAGSLAAILGGIWCWRLIRTATRGDVSAGVGTLLVAVGLGSGSSISAAIDAARTAARRYGVEVSLSVAEATLDLAAEAGVPAADLLRAEAHSARRASAATAHRAAERLAVHLTAPMGLCVLPAFLAWAVVPAFAGVLGATLSGVAW